MQPIESAEPMTYPYASFEQTMQKDIIGALSKRGVTNKNIEFKRFNIMDDYVVQVLVDGKVYREGEAQFYVEGAWDDLLKKVKST